MHTGVTQNVTFLEMYGKYGTMARANGCPVLPHTHSSSEASSGASDSSSDSSGDPQGPKGPKNSPEACHEPSQSTSLPSHTCDPVRRSVSRRHRASSCYTTRRAHA